MTGLALAMLVAALPQDAAKDSAASTQPIEAALLAPRTADPAFAEALAALGPEARKRGDALLAMLAAACDRYAVAGVPPLMRAVFREPAKSEDLLRAAIPQADAWRAAPFRGAADLVARLAGGDPATLPPAHGTFQVGHPDAAIWYLDFLINAARVRHAEHVTVEAARRGGLRPLVVDRLDNLRVTGPDAARQLEALRALPNFDAMKAASMLAHFDVVPAVAADAAQWAAGEIPPELAGAIEGSIVQASQIDELGWVVVGGPGANRYDLGRIAAVFEIGGDDRYDWRHDAAAHRLVVDLAGNDLHAGGDTLGPAGALGAVAVIDDHAGNDRYEGGALTAGSALGVSAIVDRAGNDRYEGGAWSLGAGAGGASIVVDLAGSDRFRGEGMALGVGGPFAVGAVVDVAGDDRSDLGERASVYGVEGERAGFGMGFGFGFRLSAPGGVGAYIDLSGRDHRRSGEFAQGCGYYFGLGFLFDAEGDDTASCDRYGLGGAAHQAAGVMIDAAGNDSYTAKTAAHLGGSWDETVAIFVDGAGDDSYRCDGLSLGGAAQQALAWFVDRGGNDLYRAGGAAIGGASGNEYHFDALRLGSLGLFCDLAGDDRYPSGTGRDLRNGATLQSGEVATQQLLGLDWVFIDRDAK